MLFLEILTTWLLPGLFWIYWVLIWPFAGVFSDEPTWSYLICLICWFTITIILRDKIHFLMSLGYWIGWPILFFAIQISFLRNEPHSWYAVSLLFILVSGILIRPDISVVRFDLWAIFIFVGKHVVRRIFTWFWCYPETYLFPFNLISGYWKISSERWYPVNERPELTGALCGQCKRFTAKSKLILGSNYPLTRLVERHKTWDSFEKIQYSALKANPPCILCNVLWHSIGENRLLQRVASDDVRPMVMIWQDRPLTRYTFAQLYQGNTAIGDRLLIHRGKLFGNSSPAQGAPSTESIQHVEQAKLWMKDCKEHHQRCNGVGNTPRKLPTRLIRIEPSSNLDSTPAIKLEVMNSTDQNIEYLAFSHCWGPTMPLKLLEANKSTFLESIEFSELSKNMQDAVRIARNLSFSYIWIDSLCIIQDSSEDWKAEAATMGDVYAGAFCTIASTGSSSSEGGCFHKRTTLSQGPCKIGASSPNEQPPDWIYIRRDDLSDFRRSVDHAILNTRGWVLQERLLSRRILHFGAEKLYWECCHRAASELNATGYVYKSDSKDFGGNFKLGKDEPWDRSSMIARRLPTPDFCSDDLQASRLIWQDSRAFWKEVRIPSIDPWSCDSIEGSRFRSALDKLSNGSFSENKTGMDSFSHCWYEIVEPYTRSNLTFSTDKLIAISGLVQQIENATKFDYVAGLWKQHLETGLLWFTAEGPGHRLLPTEQTTDKTSKSVDASAEISAEEKCNGIPPKPTEEAAPKPETASTNMSIEEREDSPPLQHTQEASFKSTRASTDTSTEAQEPRNFQRPIRPKEKTYIAPSWSWASIRGTVTLDMLPENAMRNVSGESLVSILSTTVNRVQSMETGRLGEALEGVLKIEGPLSKISNIKLKRNKWLINLDKRGHSSARLFPDVDISDDNISISTELFCLACLVLSKEAEGHILRSSREEVQGLLLRRLEKRENAPDIYERVGFFTTNRMDKVSSHRKRLKNATKELIHII